MSNVRSPGRVRRGTFALLGAGGVVLVAGLAALSWAAPQAPGAPAQALAIQLDCASGLVTLRNDRAEKPIDVDYRVILAQYPSASPECAGAPAAQ
ncbi:MAG TPA: hypothetical protein VGS03_12690, partial [Candidatus Polarisedimenticolia bacterium]|nr:hypothetical protein [Candidatus Polarisedimenticolia bacterium]